MREKPRIEKSRSGRAKTWFSEGGLNSLSVDGISRTKRSYRRAVAPKRDLSSDSSGERDESATEPNLNLKDMYRNIVIPRVPQRRLSCACNIASSYRGPWGRSWCSDCSVIGPRASFRWQMRCQCVRLPSLYAKKDA